MAEPSVHAGRRAARAHGRHGSFRAGFAYGALSFLAVAVLSVLSTIVSSRLYGVRTIGQFALVSAPVAALWVLSTAREQAALIKEVTRLPPRHPRVTQLFAAVFTFSSLLTAAMSALAALASWLIFTGPLRQPGLVAPALVSLAGYAIVTNTGWNLDSIFSAFVAGRQLFWVRLHEVFSFIAIAVAIGLAWRSVWGLVIATIGASLTALVHRLALVRPFVRAGLSAREYRQGLRALPGLLRFGLAITPGSIAQGVSPQAGVWAIGTVGTLAGVGAYGRALSIAMRFQQANTRVVEMLYPTLVGRRARGDGAGFDRALIDSMRYALAGMLLIAAVCGGAARSVMELFGPGFGRGSGALALLALYPALSSVVSTQTQALYAVGRPGFTSIVGVARLALVIVLTVLLTPWLALAGPAVALLTGLAFDVAWKAMVLRPYLSQPLGRTWPLRERATLAGAYCLAFAGARLLAGASSQTGGLVLAATAGTVVYTVALFGGGAINVRDRRRLREAAEALGAWRARRRGAPPPTPALDGRGPIVGAEMARGSPAQAAPRGAGTILSEHLRAHPSLAGDARPRAGGRLPGTAGVGPGRAGIPRVEHSVDRAVGDEIP